MSPVLMNSQSFVFAAAMAVSGVALFFSFARPKPFPTTHLPENQILRSCLSSDERRRERGKNTKRVTFAEEVKVVELMRSQPLLKKMMRHEKTLPCRDEIMTVDERIPANRVALYQGILRDRVHVHRMACSY